MSGQAPSEGQKVTPGKNAPTYSEAAGTVTKDSLAADSYREGGGFASNRGGQPSEISGAIGQTGTRSAGSYEGGGGASEQGGTGPSYVETQNIRDSAGPHGKNLKEVDSFEGGRPGNSIEAEPGSEWDPARAAEQNMSLNQTRGASGTGARQGGVDHEQRYGALDSETSA